MHSLLLIPRMKYFPIIHSLLRRFALPVACALAFSNPAPAQLVSPLPDGAYPNQNTAEGEGALLNLTTGSENTATGFHVMFTNTIGSKNTANGAGALFSNTNGNGNTAVGFQALESNTTGSRNTATGTNALEENNAGDLNTASGYNALYQSTGSNNIGLGANAGVYLRTGSYNIDIGNSGIPSDTGKIRIGIQGVQTGTAIAGIYGVAVAGSPVIINSNGKLGVASSSARFKEAIKPMNNASEAILALRPVSFRYKEEIDPARTRQFGLIAEEVEEVNADLVRRDETGKADGVRYEAVNAMLLNEFLKEHAQVQQLKATLAQQQKQIEILTATVQKVSDRLQLNNPEPQVAANDY